MTLRYHSASQGRCGAGSSLHQESIELAPKCRTELLKNAFFGSYDSFCRLGSPKLPKSRHYRLVTDCFRIGRRSGVTVTSHRLTGTILARCPCTAGVLRRNP